MVEGLSPLELGKFFVKLTISVKALVGGFNPLPDIPILGSSNTAANKDIMSKIWTNGDAII